MSCLCFFSDPQARPHHPHSKESAADEAHHHHHGSTTIHKFQNLSCCMNCRFFSTWLPPSTSSSRHKNTTISSRSRSVLDMPAPSSSSYVSSYGSSSSQPHIQDDYFHKAYSSPAVLMKEPSAMKNEFHDRAVKELDNGASMVLPSILDTPLYYQSAASEILPFSYSDLCSVTQNFTHVLGEGGFGCVFKGKMKVGHASLDDRGLPVDRFIEVAVKQLNKNGNQGDKEWLAEIRFLGMVDHPNLVKLLGYCGEDHERGIQRLLVYEFMENGSLENHLFTNTTSPLTWKMRLDILLGTAQALAYLHEEIDGIQVIFRDFKTSNILLDANFNPKISDFGLARQGPRAGETHVSTTVLGTLGYAAPEYIQTGHLTVKSDVWSFGVVVLEMLSGRTSLDKNRPRHEQNLLEWARPCLQGNRRINHIMDSKLVEGYSLVQAKMVLRLARECLSKYPKERPSMSAIVQKLKDIINHSDVNDTYVTPQPRDEDIKKPIRLKGHQHHPQDVGNIRWIPKALCI